MILTLQLGDQQVTTGCPDDSLVFNGTAWVAPIIGGYAVLAGNTLNTANTLGYPSRTKDLPGGFINMIKYQCLILDVNPGNTASGVLNLPDPMVGQNLCLVHQTGPQILNVQVKQI